MRLFKNWQDFPREDLRLIPLMEGKGWEVKFSANDLKYKRTSPTSVPHDAVMFTKLDKIAWVSKYGGRLHWRVAEIDGDGIYHNHRTRDTLQEVAEKE